MTEAELELLLLRYNILSKKRATAAYMWRHAGESVRYEAEWSECVNEMIKMNDDLHEYGYKFTYANSKIEGKFQYNVYKIVPVNDQQTTFS